MSAKTKKQHNLRSHKGTSIQVSVELQVSDDNKFLNSILEKIILAQQTNDDSGDSDQSGSLNLSDAVHGSDDNDQIPCSSDRSFDKFHTGNESEYFKQCYWQSRK